MAGYIHAKFNGQIRDPNLEESITNGFNSRMKPGLDGKHIAIVRNLSKCRL